VQAKPQQSLSVLVVVAAVGLVISVQTLDRNHLFLELA
jgi:hypothetical protein